MKQFFHSFVYAFKGIISCIRYERNFRFDICVAIFVIWFKTFYNFTNTENALLYICIFLVLGAEAFNTAIEASVDLISDKHTRLGKIAKDTAAGAVLLTATGSVFAGICLFNDTKVLKKFFLYLYDNPVVSFLLALYIIAAYCFTFLMFRNNKIDKEK